MDFQHQFAQPGTHDTAVGGAFEVAELVAVPAGSGADSDSDAGDGSAALAAEEFRVAEPPEPPSRFGALIGRHPSMQRVYGMVERVAPTDVTVLIVGDSGSGKELVAYEIHVRSQRQAGPFVAINCGAIPATLIEAELFGYEKGSFTGASRAHAGVFERARGGTLFLDEITEMPIEMQTRLLRVLETQRFCRVGGTQEIRTDIRVVAATNRDPFHAVRDGRLREDVLYRLAVFPIHVPPLRERGDDLRLLAEHFLAERNAACGTAKHYSEQALAHLHQHPWPGNVRELRNAVERAYILGDDELELVPLGGANGAVGPGGGGAIHVPVGARLDQVERSLIEATLRHYQGNKRRAAQVLGCSLKTLYNKLKGYAREPAWAES